MVRTQSRSAGQRSAAILIVCALASCTGGDDAADTSEPARTLDQRIDAVIATGDPTSAFDCGGDEVSGRSHLVMPVWDFEGAVDAPTPEAAADLILADDMWRDLELPNGDERRALVDRRFGVGNGLYFPVLVDDELSVLLAYDAQGPDTWSVSGGVWCDPAP